MLSRLNNRVSPPSAGSIPKLGNQQISISAVDFIQTQNTEIDSIGLPLQPSSTACKCAQSAV
jgi:hypothetical protein